MRVDLDERPGSPQSTNEPGEIGVGSAWPPSELQRCK
jgi:hypothetical protein